MRSRAMTMVAAAMAVLAVGSIAAAPAGGGGPFHRFDQSLQEYVALRNFALRGVPPLEITQDFAKIREAVDARAAAIQGARVDARQGDLFVGELAADFRARIRGALDANGVTAAALLAAG